MIDPRLGYPSCSSLPRIMGCSASYLREREAAKRLKPPKDDGSAASGTRVHAALAGEIPMDTLDVWECWIADRCLELEDGLRFKLGLTEDDPNVVSLGGKRLWWKDPSKTEADETNISGEIDKLIMHRGKRIALINDYKTGRVEVEGAADNWQLGGYGWLSLFFDDRLPATIDTLYVAITQPQADLPVTLAKYTRAEAEALGKRIEKQLDRSANPEAKATPGKHCTYCKARGSCAEALEYVENGLVPIKDVQVVKSGRKTEFIVPTLTPQEIVEYLPKKRILKAIMAGLDQQAKQYAAEGVLPGYALKDGDERVTFTNLLTAWKKIKDFTGLRPLLRCLSVKVGELDDAVAVTVNIPKKAARDWWRTQLAGSYEITRDESELMEVKK